MSKSYIGYGVAVLAVVSATGIAMAIGGGYAASFGAFFVAILVTAWLGGVGAVLTATLLGVLSVDWFFVPPAGALWPVGRAGALALVILVAFGLATAAMESSLKRRARELAREREQFQVTLASIGDGVIVTDTDSRVTFINEVAQELTGWDHADARGRPLDEVFPIFNEATREPSRNPVDRALEQGSVVGLANHTILVARDGTEHAIDDSAAPIRQRDGTIVGVVLVFRDVTDKRTLEAARQHLAAVVESSEDAILGQTLEGTITAWNRGAERMFGYTEEETVGRPIFETIAPPSRRQELLGVLGRVGRGERVDHFVTVRRHKEGHQIPVSIGISPIRDEYGEIVGASAIDRDISARVLADQRRELRLAVTEILADSTDVDTAVPRILRAACEALGWDVGVFWQVHPGEAEIRCEALWDHEDDVGSEADGGGFRAATRQLRFPPGSSLPGRVWESRRPHWIEDVGEDPGFMRAAAARDAGLHGAFAWPVAVGDRFLGVLEFFSQQLQPPDEELLELAATLGGQVGQFIERRRAEADLRRSERELSDFFDNATMGLHWVGPDGTILRANRCELELLGYEEEEYVGHPISEFHVDEPVIEEILARLRSGETLEGYPARMRCKDGSIRHVMINSSVMWEEGEFVHTRCFTRDVTEQVRLREELQERLEELTEAEARVRSVVDHVVDGIITIDGSGTVESFNPAAEDIFGYEASEVIGSNVKMLMPQPYRDEDGGYIESYQRTGDAQIIGNGREAVGLRKDGTEFPMDLAVSEFRLGERPFYTGIVRDITERRRMEDALRFLAEASRTLSSLHDSRSTLQKIARLAVPAFADWCTVLVVDEEGETESLAVSHVDPDRAPTVRRLHADGPRHGAGAGFLRVLRTGKPQLITEVDDDDLRALAGSEEQLRALEDLAPRSWLSVPLEAEGRILGVLTFVYSGSRGRYEESDLEMAHDLAHRASIAIDNARLYEKLREADQRKDEFLAMLSHELRNPLAPIRTGLEILALRHGGDKIIDSIQSQIAHLVRLVDDLLDVSRIMRGRVELREETIGLTGLVRQTVAGMRSQADQRNQDLSVSLPDEEVTLFADPVRVAQILDNLLSNASKYTESGGRIQVKVETDEGEAVIRVRDTGIGMEPELLPRVFDLFIQSPRSLERTQGGLGIGLTLVRQLVELHGGTVTAHSAGPGEGSEFVVRLPIREGSARGRGAAVREGPVPPRRILVVDDNTEAAQLLSGLLQTVGEHEVEVAYDGPSALEKVRAFDPQVVLLDIGLPGMDGYEVSRRLRKDPRFSSLLLVAVTGYGQEEDRRKSRQAGFDDHLVKPASAEEIEAVLGHPKLDG